ncbi:spore gernimation protein KB [Mesobacillus campisalis]|uniref:Spore gernimation protein KB n=1 Tax=Mesobacillus campisalis TaxID=1408103 RepID=A0A0M2T0C3_9BACI|nr:GerAB/ArcD/ProY family transporter [Mesobacillus campisalis]KKK38682.1 spore gernimation protein KB [Mesobacillus campisalis]
MEKAKISAYQLFVMIVLFELGSAVLVPIASGAKQDAWIAILVGMAGGFLLFGAHYRLYRYYPEITPIQYMQKLLGKFFGKLLAFSYIVLFMYFAARVLRDFGEMLLTFAYVETPLFIVNAMLIMVVVYAVIKGIEVLARTGELFFLLLYLLAVIGFILIVSSGLIELTQLMPVLEEGWGRVLKVVATETISVPFGEAVVFSMILPYLDNKDSGLGAGMFGLFVAGINLSIVMAINISVQGVEILTRSQFPLLTTVQSIQMAEFLERLDVFFMVSVIIGIFFKVSLYFYAAVSGTAILFNIKEPSRLVYPLGLVVLFMSITIASSYSEHIKEGLGLMAKTLQPFFLVLVPVFLLGIAYLKNRKKQA